MPYGVVVTIVLMFWLINCSRQTFMLSLNYLNVGASYCTNVVFCCYFLTFFSLFYTIIFLLFMGSACYWNKVKWSEAYLLPAMRSWERRTRYLFLLLLYVFWLFLFVFVNDFSTNFACGRTLVSDVYSPLLGVSGPPGRKKGEMKFSLL